MLKTYLLSIVVLLSFSFQSTFAADCQDILKDLLVNSIGNTKVSKNAQRVIDYVEDPQSLPPFTDISPDDYLEAFSFYEKAYRTLFQDILSQTEKPTFKNTLQTLEKLERKIFDLQTAFAHMSHMYLSEYNEASLKLWNAADELEALQSHNKDFYNKLKKIKTDDLLPEQRLVVARYIEGFENSGISLPLKKKKQLLEIDKKISNLTNEFSMNSKTSHEKFRYIIHDESQLEGIPEEIVKHMKKEAVEEGIPDSWAFSMRNPSVFMSILRNGENRELRKALILETRNLGSEAPYDNRQILIDIVNLRHKKAQILGYKSYSDMALKSRMAKTVERVEEFYEDLVQNVRPIAVKENQELIDFAHSIGHKGKVEPWDRVYYYEKLKQAKYGFNSEVVRPYFQLSHVTEGLFKIVREVFNVEVREIPIESYHKSVKLFEIYDHDTQRVTGRLFYDPFARENKTDGAHHMKLRLNDGETPSLGAMVTNFAEAENGDALLDFSQVETVFHEFGHALHATLSESRYIATSTAYTPRDFVELQSQFLENFLREPYVLEMVGKHYQTGEVIPQDLIQKLQEANNFRKASLVLGQAQMGMLDMAFYKKPLTIKPDELIDWEDSILKDTYITPPRFRASMATTFDHIFSGGYSAGYYGYIWAEILDKDAYAFVMRDALENGRPNPEKMKLLKRWVYSDGTHHTADEQYDLFKGGEKLDTSHFADILKD